mmetsp:Transcript_19853/g.64726  ORF Transcript_19853/g.64726 Transcript_19853/m.64726 type:complete len:289 (-) Transcript_19853:2-868(-)
MTTAGRLAQRSQAASERDGHICKEWRGVRNEADSTCAESLSFQQSLRNSGLRPSSCRRPLIMYSEFACTTANESLRAVGNGGPARHWLSCASRTQTLVVAFGPVPVSPPSTQSSPPSTADEANAVGTGIDGSGRSAVRSHGIAKVLLMMPSGVWPPAQTTCPLIEPQAAYAVGAGSTTLLSSQVQEISPPSVHTLSSKCLVLVQVGNGKLLPPAKTSLSSQPPDSAPAKPSGSGRSGSCVQFSGEDSSEEAAEEVARERKRESAHAAQLLGRSCALLRPRTIFAHRHR